MSTETGLTAQGLREQVAEKLWNGEQLVPWSRVFGNPDWRHDLEVHFERVDELLAEISPVLEKLLAERDALKAELSEARRVITALPDPGTVEELREKITDLFGDSNEAVVDAFLNYAWSETARIAGKEMAARWQAQDELDEARAAIEKGQVARFAADVLRLVDDYSDEGRSLIARLPFLATFDQVCFEKYGIRTDKLAALDTPRAPESPRENHVDRHGRSWDRHPFMKSSRVGDNVAICVCGQSPEHEIHTPETPGDTE